MNTKIQVLPQNKIEQEIQQELGNTRASFEVEYHLFTMIKEGQSELLQQGMDEFFAEKVVMGRMTGNTTRQLQYWAVATIAVAVHYAILGGLEENEAFNTSDEVIRKIDRCTESDEIFEILGNEAINLCEKVKNCKTIKTDNQVVKKCLRYINEHIKERITLEDLAEQVNLSSGYLSKVFRKETGMKVNEYVMKEKLENAKARLMAGSTISDVAFELGFCTESYFIECFRKQYGITPGKS